MASAFAMMIDFERSWRSVKMSVFECSFLTKFDSDLQTVRSFVFVFAFVSHFVFVIAFVFEWLIVFVSLFVFVFA